MTTGLQKIFWLCSHSLSSM